MATLATVYFTQMVTQCKTYCFTCAIRFTYAIL